MCGTLVINGSMSDTSNSLSAICTLYGLNKYTLQSTVYNNVKDKIVCKFYDYIREDDKQCAAAIQDMLYLRDRSKSDHDRHNLNTLLDNLCTSWIESLDTCTYHVL